MESERDRGGGMIVKHYTRGGRLEVKLRSQSVGGSYLFQDKYINHVSGNGLTTLSKCTPTSMPLNSHFSALLSVLI